MVTYLDNNATESTICGFCIGKHNWHMIDTMGGVKFSARIYRIPEMVNVNYLKPYEYLLEEIPQHMEDKEHTFSAKLLPGHLNSQKIP